MPVSSDRVILAGASGLGVVTDMLIHSNFRPCRYLL